MPFFGPLVYLFGLRRGTADLSTALRSGRDDKGKMEYLPKCRLAEKQMQISPLRAARSGRDDKSV